MNASSVSRLKFEEGYKISEDGRYHNPGNNANYVTYPLMNQQIDLSNFLFNVATSCPFPYFRNYIENIRTMQYSQYIHSLLDFGYHHHSVLNVLYFRHCPLLLLSQVQIDMALKVYRLIPLKCHLQNRKIPI